MNTFLPKTAMILAGIIINFFAQATTITVTVTNFSFTPSNFTANIGDTVEWVWSSGSHTTTSTSVPNGAATWSNPMNNSNTTFKYKITTAGTYNYWCAIHTSSMEASFTVNLAGVPAVSNSSKFIAQVFPNPANDIANVRYYLPANSNVEINVYNEAGKAVKLYSGFNIGEGYHIQEINVSEFSTGIYYCRIITGISIAEIKFVVIK